MCKIKRVISNIIYPVVPFSENKPFKDYKTLLDTRYFAVYSNSKEMIVAANDNVVCTQLVDNSNILFLYPNINTPNRRFKIEFNSDNFPRLIRDSKIQTVLLIPYITKTAGRTKKWRLVIITNQCQLYHNFPDRCVSAQQAMTTFCQSMVWDLPGNRYPSNNINCESYEQFFPFLSDSSYDYFTDNDSEKVYHINCDNGIEVDLSRFYFPNRGLQSNPFYYFNGFEPDPIMTFIGTYCGNASVSSASRIVVFATSDGGVNWFAKYEFNDDATAENYGSNLRIHPSWANEKIEFDDVYLHKRDLVPCDKEVLKLQCGNGIKVKQIIQKDTLEVELEDEHKLQSGNIVALKGQGNNNVSESLLNNSFTDGEYGNGVFYKIKVIDDTTIQLFECVSKSRTNLPARHIHSINRVKDGFLVATGETYPQGWIMMFSVIDADNWTNISASDNIPIVRLNSSMNSVQRIVGAILLDNKEHEFVYASDCSTMNTIRDDIIDGIPTNSIGIYKGKLADIDDFHKFELLQDVKEPSFFFKELDGCYVFIGQRGEIAIGMDNGRLWHRARLEKPLVRYMGRTLNFFVIDGKILRIK